MANIMNLSVHSILVILAILSFGCSKPADERSDAPASDNASTRQPDPSQSPAQSDSEAVRLSSEAASSAAAAAVAKSQAFPAYTPEMQAEIKSLKGGEWIPVKIDRSYLILREKGGIYLASGDYFVQLLSNADGRVAKFLLSKKRGASLAQMDFAKGRASDGSFAEVLDFVAEVGVSPNPETRAYCSASGESGAVWVHLAGRTNEWRGELMGFARGEKLTTAQ
jgi:hypothetical protein